MDEPNDNMTPKELYARGERRAANRATGEVAFELTRLRNAVALEHAIAMELAATAKRLFKENRELRMLVKDQTRLLDDSEFVNDGNCIQGGYDAETN